MPTYSPGTCTKNRNGWAHAPVSKPSHVRIPSMGTNGRPSAVPFTEIQQMRAAHEAGESVAKIARRFGYDQGVVRNWCDYVQRVWA